MNLTDLTPREAGFVQGTRYRTAHLMWDMRDTTMAGDVEPAPPKNPYDNSHDAAEWDRGYAAGLRYSRLQTIVLDVVTTAIARAAKDARSDTPPDQQVTAGHAWRTATAVAREAIKEWTP